MSEDNLKKLTKSKNIRTSTIAMLALNNKISFTEAEKQYNSIISECLLPTGLRN